MRGIRTLSLFTIFGLTASCATLFGTNDTEVGALSGLASCTTVPGEAVICGTVFAADGITPIVGTEITQGSVVATSASVSSTTDLPLKGVTSSKHCITDATGKFACAGIPEAGDFTFNISGSGVKFSFTANVIVGSTVDTFGTTATATATTTNWLAVQGTYDGIQLLLSQLKGCSLTGLTASPASLSASKECTDAKLEVISNTAIPTTFNALSNISAYSYIFINSGAGDLTKYKTVLQEYVAQGGNLYFSDDEISGIKAAFPDKITFGDNANTTTGTVSAATVDYNNLASILGANIIDIIFDLPKWQPVTKVASGVTSYITGNTASLGGTTSAPILVGWTQGDGGCILYSSYHTAAPTSVVSGQEKALKYLIQNVDTECK